MRTKKLSYVKFEKFCLSFNVIARENININIFQYFFIFSFFCFQLLILLIFLVILFLCIFLVAVDWMLNWFVVLFICFFINFDIMSNVNCLKAILHWNCHWNFVIFSHKNLIFCKFVRNYIDSTELISAAIHMSDKHEILVENIDKKYRQFSAYEDFKTAKEMMIQLIKWIIC